MQECLIGSGIRFAEICDPKFRSCLLTLHFYVHRSREAAALHALLPDLLTASSAAYPSVSEMALQLESLYAADFSAKLTLSGDDAVLSFTASWLDDSFALNGEPITLQMLRLVTDALLHPNASDGAFCEPEFRICKQNLLDDILCEQNDKRSYALRRAAELAYTGEPAEWPPCGTEQAAAALTAEQVYAGWQEILRTAFVDIAAVTPAHRPEIRAHLTAVFGQMQRTPAELVFPAPSPCKPMPRVLTESMPVGQTKLVMAYKYTDIPRAVLIVLCGILGWISDALLFVGLRERESLCYYCCLQCSVAKQTLFIDSGVDADDLEKAQQRIRAQIAALCRGDFTDEMTERAVLRYICQTAAAFDSPYDTAAERLLRSRLRDDRTPQQLAEALRSVTREQIIAAAGQLREDSVFVLRADREEASADA